MAVIVVNGAVIEDKKLLVVKKRDFWILPGGKREKGENDISCLMREFREELNGTDIDSGSVRYYRQFHGTSPSEKLIDVNVYYTRLNGAVRGVSGEIKDFKWLNYNDIKLYGCSIVSRESIDSLHKDGFF